jgi:hypothetical protein
MFKLNVSRQNYIVNKNHAILSVLLSNIYVTGLEIQEHVILGNLIKLPLNYRSIRNYFVFLLLYTWYHFLLSIVKVKFT